MNKDVNEIPQLSSLNPSTSQMTQSLYETKPKSPAVSDQNGGTNGVNTNTNYTWKFGISIPIPIP